MKRQSELYGETPRENASSYESLCLCGATNSVTNKEPCRKEVDDAGTNERRYA